MLLEPASNFISKNEGEKEKMEGKLLGESVSVCRADLHKVQLVFSSVSSCRGVDLTQGQALPGDTAGQRDTSALKPTVLTAARL